MNSLNLRRLNFPNNEAGPHIELVASPTFANLRWANFRNSDSAFDNPSIIPLAECPDLANLEHLDFGECEQWDASLSAVASAAHWNKLRYLNLSYCFFSLETVTELFNTRNLSALAELDLSSNDGTYPDEVAIAVVNTPLFARLSKLWLGRPGITDEGAKVLLEAPSDVNLTLLDLPGSELSSDVKQALQERFGSDVCVFERDEEDV